jgi:ubiquinone/menaquinone biosynthesis C-methylase UbiE
MIKLDVGCGDQKREGHIGIDNSKGADADIFLDIEKQKLPFEDNQVDVIFCSHVLEHLDNVIFVVNEFWRVLKPEGEATIVVPDKTNERAIAITHKRFFDKQTFDFFTQKRSKKMYDVCLWKIEEIVLNERKDIHVRMIPLKI